ncbi:hypothetical protein [Variovorax sp. Root434]|uniref:hypothetical protein n=1 Tax=Variovorax sp. Root434 TaxID=1736536 RepID=UPI001F2FC4B3|nr:hypothetical protein [Variovorax sp. Root434]
MGFLLGAAFNRHLPPAPARRASRFFRRLPRPGLRHINIAPLRGLDEANRECGVAVLFVTHNPELAGRRDRILQAMDGMIRD